MISTSYSSAILKLLPFFFISLDVIIEWFYSQPHHPTSKKGKGLQVAVCSSCITYENVFTLLLYLNNILTPGYILFFFLTSLLEYNCFTMVY